MQNPGDGAKKSDGIGSVPTPMKLLMGTCWDPSGIQPSMSDLIVWSVNWMELLKSWYFPYIPVAMTGEDVAWKFVWEWV